MPRKLILCLIAFIYLFLSCQTGGQVQKDYAIHFQSGDYIPPQNLEEMIRQPKLLSPGVFNNNYYAVLQFENLPDSLTKKRIGLNGIRLLQYLPQLAYAVAIPTGRKLDVLKEGKVRGLFVPNAKHKMSRELVDRKFPKWAVPQKNYIDVVVTTFEKLELNLVQEQLKAVEANTLKTEENFSTLTLRLPQRNLDALASLPFILSVEPAPEPENLERLPGIREN